jgi:hypothetical protein
LARTYLRKVDVLEREILHENVKSLTNNIIIAKTFNDEVRMANRKRAIRLVSMHKERILNEMATEIEK